MKVLNFNSVFSSLAQLLFLLLTFSVSASNEVLVTERPIITVNKGGNIPPPRTATIALSSGLQEFELCNNSNSVINPFSATLVIHTNQFETYTIVLSVGSIEPGNCAVIGFLIPSDVNCTTGQVALTFNSNPDNGLLESNDDPTISDGGFFGSTSYNYYSSVNCDFNGLENESSVD